MGKKKKRGLGLLLLVSLCAVCFAWVNSNIRLPVKNAPQLQSRCALLLDAKTGKTLYEKNSDKRAFPASLTKMMTALVVIENSPSLDKQVTLPSEMFDRLTKADASMAGFLPGETVRLRDLLYGILLPSGAEAAEGAAVATAGSLDRFVSLMNEKAKSLGMRQTHFVNVTGLQDNAHYTTAQDMGCLLRYAMKNETFREIFTSSRHATAQTNLHPGGITVYSTLFQKCTDPNFSGGRIIGGKTGYTQAAGLCLASAAICGGKEYYCVTLGASGEASDAFHITDTLALYQALCPDAKQH